MACCDRTIIPTIRVTNIAYTASTAVLTLNSPIPTVGRFNLRFNCVCINPCAMQTVTIPLNPTGTAIIQLRCGNYMQLGQIASHVRCRQTLQMNVTSNPAGGVFCLDRASSPASNVPASSCCTSVTKTTSSSSASEENVEAANAFSLS